MQCQTVLPGTECTFWSKKGCIFQGNTCENIVEACQGCERIVSSEAAGQVCSVSPSPTRKWAGGLCNMATHRKVEILATDAKTNPLKASKKASAKKK